jgi:4-diphosphocytidyl-2-C-methyl-D-erythritol kinase
MRLVLRPPAKINLTLEIGERRADGFHDVRTVMQAITLSDTLTLTSRRGPLSLEGDAPGVPMGAGNLVWRAAELLWRTLGRSGPARDAQMRLVKRIPAAAGLGGGSADAAAALVGLNRLWRGRLSRAELARLGGELGSDVPFFLCGGTALGLGRGEHVYPLPDVPRHAVVIVTSPQGVSTADAYRWLDDDRARQSARDRSDHGRAIDVGWPNGPLSVSNDLEASVRRRLESVGESLEALTKLGALVASMTGSGSAVFGLCRAADVARVKGRLERAGRQVLLARTLSRRESLSRIDPVINS